MKLSSEAFDNNSQIPSKYTCDSDSPINPPLLISDIPNDARTLVLIMDDPDVPKSIREDGMWDHWIVFNIAIKGLETLKIEEEEEPDGICGKGTAGNLKYYPPCPPDTEHRYVFKAYTLSDELSLPEGSIKKEVEKAMEGKIIDKAELVGLYERK